MTEANLTTGGVVIDANLWTERARIRRELLEWIDSKRAKLMMKCGNLVLWESDLRAALDRICPEGEAAPEHREGEPCP